ncbi:hypothetical protein A2U01_0064889, partial [Trifolium medium]|nr:hypothetical protein [Trifolium medium]
MLRQATNKQSSPETDPQPGYLNPQ